MPQPVQTLTPNQTAIFGDFTFKFGADLVLYVQWSGLNSFIALRQLPALTASVMVTAADLRDAQYCKENPSVLPKDWQV